MVCVISLFSPCFFQTPRGVVWVSTLNENQGMFSQKRIRSISTLKNVHIDRLFCWTHVFLLGGCYAKEACRKKRSGKTQHDFCWVLLRHQKRVFTFVECKFHLKIHAKALKRMRLGFSSYNICTIYSSEIPQPRLVSCFCWRRWGKVARSISTGRCAPGILWFLRWRAAKMGG